MAKHEYFGTDGIRGRVGQWPMTSDFVLKLGWAAGKVLARAGYGKVLIGKDTRISCDMLEAALIAGLSASGVDVHLLGVMPTPAISYLTHAMRKQAGIVISASHNPYFDNGIKFFSSDGYKLADELEDEIEQQLSLPITSVGSDELGRLMRLVDIKDRYIDYCKSTIAEGMSFKGLKIIVDCANGATYQIAPKIFRQLGAEVIEKCVEPNGVNINLNCGATHPEFVREQVLKHHADVGIAFDGDGDRVIMVDHAGNIVDGDALIYLIVLHRIANKAMKGGVVGTVMTNYGLEEALAAHNIEFIRTAVGDRHIMEELIKRRWFLGGEPSGHVVCMETSTTGDGMITALQVLAAMQQKSCSLAELTAKFKKYPQVIINVMVQKKDDPEQLPQLQAEIARLQSELKNGGRICLRRSGTQPVVRVMVEGGNAAQVKEMADHLATVVSNELG